MFEVKATTIQKIQRQILKGNPTDVRPGDLFLKNLKKARVKANAVVSGLSGIAMVAPMAVATPDNLMITGSIMATFMGVSGYKAISAYEGYRTKRDQVLLACVAHRMGVVVTDADSLAAIKLFASAALGEDQKKRPGAVLKDSLAQLFMPHRTFEKRVERVLKYKGLVQPRGL